MSKKTVAELAGSAGAGQRPDPRLLCLEERAGEGLTAFYEQGRPLEKLKKTHGESTTAAHPKHFRRNQPNVMRKNW
jgi:hypothetical protein